MMILAVATSLLPVFLTTLSREFGGEAGLSAEQLGRVGAFTFVGLVVGILVTGPLADWLGGRLFAVGGNLLVAIGLAMLAYAPTYSMVLIASGVMGLGAGALDMILSPIVSALQPHRRAIAMNLLHSFYCTGAVITILAGSVALRYDVSWRTLALALLAAPLLIGLAFAFVKLPPLVESGGQRMRLAALMRQPYFLVALLALFLGGATEIGMAYWLPAYAEKTLGYSPWTAGMALLAFSVAMTLGRLGIAFLPMKINVISLMLACCVASVILFVIASFSPIAAIAVGACVLVGLTGSCLWPSTLAVAADRYPHGGATMFALLAAMGNFGGIFMPWAVGVVADRSSLRWGLVTSALCPLLMIGLLLWMRRRTPATPPDDVTRAQAVVVGRE